MSEYSGKKVATFKERFTELCDSSPMNDTAIAKALHVSRQTVCSWKSGARSPKRPTIVAISDYFGVDIAWLMGFDVKKMLDKSKDQRVIPIVVPDTERFIELVKYMPHDEYIMVMDAFSRAEKRLKEKEEKEKANDSLQTETGF